jgi:NAD-dependent deacetylase
VSAYAAISGTQAIAALARRIADAHRILVFTGAGISTASGIPDYRGPRGVWKERRPVFYDEFMSSEAARRTYWQQKLEDRQAFGEAEPNEVHRALVRLERSGRVELLVTQNIDGLHRAAGSDVQRLVEIHGTSSLVECQTCGTKSEPGPPFDTFAASGRPPVCPCGGYLKPATISFGQPLRQGDLLRAFTAADRADLVLALGSTLAVTPAADIPLAAANSGAGYVIVNHGPTEHDRLAVVTLRIEGDVAEIVPAAVDTALG